LNLLARRPASPKGEGTPISEKQVSCPRYQLDLLEPVAQSGGLLAVRDKPQYAGQRTCQINAPLTVLRRQPDFLYKFSVTRKIAKLRRTVAVARRVRGSDAQLEGGKRCRPQGASVVGLAILSTPA
jgi:hypothetical protein